MKWQKTKKAISNIGSTLSLIVLAVILINVVTSKMSGEYPSIFGYQMKAVLSGSMEPDIKTGSIIFIKITSEGDRFEKGDVITFITKENVLVTHRITEIKDGGSRFITKGDNNNGPDLEPVHIKNIVGQYTGITIPYAGYLFKITESQLGAALLLFLPGILLVGYGLITLWRTMRIPEKYKDSEAQTSNK
ncbi:MAG TPA: signal peptidase I [Bacillus bacterium]|uniref:Signal peptidase I n=1 Tax=Siminovitchia fordii TaxID=254759 RepID=A0ABQ4K9R1_9BACI|nr:signal peptidase I [Siminovitchia fordii]GIN21815.1 S26 family signal peptidase [Siminovitchia fordii]HBZ11697.1 signal peptidase I [Bacillus sp. (in: firmicutes)]